MAQSIMYHLFANTEAKVYAVLDAASIPNFLELLDEHKPGFERLFAGELEPGMAEVIPYLVQLDPQSEFTSLISEKGWGNHWGIYAISEANIRTLRLHFRSFLQVYDPDYKPLYFRYYDPRVLRVYLPTCTPAELKTVFGPVEYFLLEDRDAGTALRFTNMGGQLVLDKIALTGD
jgi:hypothetical protein